MQVFNLPPLPIMAMVNATFRTALQNPLAFLRACLFPALLTILIAQWQSPPDWGVMGYHLSRIVQWGILLWLWTASARQIQRFLLKGPMQGATGFLPRLDAIEGRFLILSILVSLPFTVFAFWYEQPIYLHQPDLLVMGSMTALEGSGLLLYSSLAAGWVTQLMAYALPMIADGDQRPLRTILRTAFESVRQDFSRLFAASLLVVLPLWLFIALVRMILHLPDVTHWALQDETAGLIWSIALISLEAFKVFIGGTILAILWALAYGRTRQNPHTSLF